MLRAHVLCRPPITSLRRGGCGRLQKVRCWKGTLTTSSPAEAVGLGGRGIGVGSNNGGCGRRGNRGGGCGGGGHDYMGYKRQMGWRWRRWAPQAKGGSNN
ncbi:hypothetical protein BHM03_00062083 [Ensete ventricosum]|nr:hypothetical protein BHM03_00062083 [Ensete ventricosum]